MKYVLDVHCHTIASGHAYSTVQEIAREAARKGLKLFALTDHGPEMPGAPNIYHIKNQRVIPRVIDGVIVLRGVEANIMDYDGGLDVRDSDVNGLDIVLASLHSVSITPGSREENTSALVGAIKSGRVDVLGHIGNPVFPIDCEKVVKAAKEHNVLIEINNSSFGPSREGSKENCSLIANLAKEHKAKVVLGSDSHISFDVGRFDTAAELLRQVEMPDELIINTSVEKLVAFLQQRGRSKIDEVADIIRKKFI